jgi:hypothetical protein
MTEDTKSYYKKTTVCNICGTTYLAHQKTRHEASNKHINHKNNILGNNEEEIRVKSLLQAQKILNELIEKSIKNDNLQEKSQMNIVQSDQNKQNYIQKYDFDKLNNIKKWEKDLFK